MKSDFDCVIIGAGIAGLTAAIYLKRANVNVLVIEKDAPGGLLNKINKIENFPGHISITGPDLAYKLYEQVNSLGIEIRYGNVFDIKNNIIKTDIEEIKAKTIILAVGRKARKLENTTNLKNISYCVLCDGNLYRNKTVALVGSNNMAFDEAIYLSDICSKVILISKEKIESEEIIYKLKTKNNIDIHDECVIKTLNSNNNILTSIITNKNEFEVDAMFVSLGYEPDLQFLNEIKKENGYIIVNDKMQTNIDYIFACGDIIKKDVYQLTTAAAEATIAAINIKKLLNK